MSLVIPRYLCPKCLSYRVTRYDQDRPHPFITGTVYDCWFCDRSWTVLPDPDKPYPAEMPDSVLALIDAANRVEGVYVLVDHEDHEIYISVESASRADGRGPASWPSAVTAITDSPDWPAGWTDSLRWEPAKTP